MAIKTLYKTFSVFTLLASCQLLSVEQRAYPLLHELLANSSYKKTGTAVEPVFESPPEILTTTWTTKTTVKRYTFKSGSPVPIRIHTYTTVVPTCLGWLVGALSIGGISCFLLLTVKTFKKRKKQ